METPTGAHAAALAMIAAPYRYGGSSPSGFDCSGLVSYTFDAAGMAVPRTTSEKLSASRAIRLSEAAEGDLLFFRIRSKADHVAIFIGDGRFVHVPSSGQQVSIASLDDPFWQASLEDIRRLLLPPVIQAPSVNLYKLDDLRAGSKSAERSFRV